MRAESQWHFALLDEAAASEICGWRYLGPYAQYDLGEGAIHTLLDPTNSYFAARDPQGALVGFCCFGPDARVPGGNYAESALDIGLGLRPELTGKGAGKAFVQAVLALGCDSFATRSFRVTIAAWNTRSLRVHELLGFRRTGAFRRTSDDLEFIQMIKLAPDSPPRVPNRSVTAAYPSNVRLKSANRSRQPPIRKSDKPPRGTATARGYGRARKSLRNGNARRSGPRSPAAASTSPR